LRPLPPYAADYIADDELEEFLATLEGNPTSVTRSNFVAEAKFPAVVGLLEKTTRQQAEKEEEWRQIANEQPYIHLGSESPRHRRRRRHGIGSGEHP
jgi:hypothetical protein